MRSPSPDEPMSIAGTGRSPTRREKLARRLRSEWTPEHLGALDELFVHQLLVQRWTDVRYEESGEGPDFRIYDSGR